jgi:hypothetical protein
VADSGGHRFEVSGSRRGKTGIPTGKHEGKEGQEKSRNELFLTGLAEGDRILTGAGA